MFNYDPSQGADRFKDNGFVHLHQVLKPDFVERLRRFYEDSMRDAEHEQGEWKIKGKKRQFLFEFASDEEAEDFRQGMSAMTGIDPDRFTISERHLKVYDSAAEAWPAPHKDRAASTVSIGLPVRLPEGSTACVFPKLDYGPNREERAVFLSEDEYGDMSKLYDQEECVMLFEEVGDVIAFLGSAIYHERVRPAGAAILYIKVNGDGRDPLGEDIYAEAMA